MKFMRLKNTHDASHDNRDSTVYFIVETITIITRTATPGHLHADFGASSRPSGNRKHLRQPGLFIIRGLCDGNHRVPEKILLTVFGRKSYRQPVRQWGA